MVRPVDQRSYVPKHVQVSDDLRERIRRAEYQPGDRLPSTPDLADAYHVAVMTVRRALATLAAEHLIRTERGVRAQVIGQWERSMVQLGEGDEVEYRPATTAERRELGLAEGEDVAEVTRADGTTKVYRPHEVRFRVIAAGDG